MALSKGKTGLLLELVIIVFGVILGLWLTNLADNRKDAKFTDKSVEVMLAELEKNYEAILRSREYHMKILPLMVNAKDAIRDEREFDGFDYTGFHTPQTTAAAYSTALSTGVFAKVDPSYARSIAQAYESIVYMRSTDTRYQNALAQSDKPFFELMSIAFSDILYAEDLALADIAQVIKKTPPQPWYQIINVNPY